MTACIHSAIAPNMNRCSVCGKVWTGERWETAAFEEPAAGPLNAKATLTVLVATEFAATNGKLSPIQIELLSRAQDAVASLLARDAELEAERVSERNEWQRQMTDVEAENKALREAYQKARNSAAGYSNYCDDDANTRRCERELDEAERMFRAIPTRT